MMFDPRLRYTIRHPESGRSCPADAAWLNGVSEAGREQWRRDGWVVVEEPCPRCEQMRGERDEARAMVAR